MGLRAKQGYREGMGKKNNDEKIGLRLELHEISDDAVAVDALVDDLVHDDYDAALHDLHAPNTEGSHYNDRKAQKPAESS